MEQQGRPEKWGGENEQSVLDLVQSVSLAAAPRRLKYFTKCGTNPS